MHDSEQASEPASETPDPHASLLASLPPGLTPHYDGYDPGAASVDFDQSAMSTWAAQIVGYPAAGPPGLSDQETCLYWSGGRVDEYAYSLMWRDADGNLLGWLDYYPQGWTPHYGPGAVDMMVHPLHRGEGIAAAMLTEATKRWPIRVEDQKYSPDGATFVNDYVQRRVERRNQLRGC